MISAITTLIIAVSTLVGSGSTDSKSTGSTSGQIITSEQTGM